MRKMEQFENPLIWWEGAKFHFKSISVCNAKIRGKLQHQERLELEQQVKRLQVKAQSGNVFDTERFLLAKKLKQLDIRDIASTKLLAKARFVEEGEKSSRYFCSLDKQQKAEHTMRILTSDNMD